MTVCAHLFGVLKVFEKSLLPPHNALVDVGRSIREAFALTGLAAKDSVEDYEKEERAVFAWHTPMEVGPHFMGLTRTEGMALSAASLEEGRALGSIA